MAPQELKIYILHDLCVVCMISAVPRSKTAYLVISINRPMSKSKEKMSLKNMKLSEVELHGTSRAEILYFACSLSSEYDFDTPRV